MNLYPSPGERVGEAPT